MRRLKRDGLLEQPWTGAWQWRDSDTNEVTAAIDLSTDVDAVFLSYTANRVPVKKWIELDFTPCNFGGTRPWFLCPGCNQRAALLHIEALHFRCRNCLGLTYRSRGEDAIGRAWLAQVKLERRLLKDLQRPKGMHHATRTHLVHKIFELENRREDLLDVGMQRLLKAGI